MVEIATEKRRVPETGDSAGTGDTRVKKRKV
jgi:hypothetical protein